MRKNVLILLLGLFFCCVFVNAQETAESGFKERAEGEYKKGNFINARALYIRAFEDFFNKGNVQEGVECGLKAVGLYYIKDTMYKEGFDLLHRIDQKIDAKEKGAARAALHYRTYKERYQMYMKIRKGEFAMEQLGKMEQYAKASDNDSLKNDLLYNKTIYYYTYGQNDKGNATFKEMADKLTASKEYDKVDKAYQTLIANGRQSNNIILVNQGYKSYIAWKDSVADLKVADERNALKQQIATHEETIAEKDSSLVARQAAIIGLSILSVILAVALVLGALVLMRFIALTRKQKKNIRILTENNALKAKFISNISAQLEPTLQKLDKGIPEVKALQDFSAHIQTLSELESGDEPVELEETQLASFCEGLMEQISNKVKSGVVLKVEAPKMTAKINKEYVSHILLHLLNNAAEYTPVGGHITLEYKKRGAHKHQFLVSDSGCGIPEEKHEDVFKPFLEIRDLTQGDGLGLPICRQMALKMNGDLDIDPVFKKGVRFVLHLQD